MIAPLVNCIQVFDNSAHILEFAARRLYALGITNRRVREEMLTVVPECTGIWWRKL